MRVDQGPNTINRENVQRRIIVQANVADRDLGSVIADVRTAIGQRIPTTAINAAPPAKTIGTAESGPPFWNNKKKVTVPTPTHIPVRVE